MFKKEPAVIIGICIAILQALLSFFTNTPDTIPDGALALTSSTTTLAPGWMSWILPALTILGGFLTRSKVFPVQKVRDAGFTPSEIEKRAASPAIATAEGE